MMAYEGSENTWDNFGKFIHLFQPETKTLIRKLERILIKLYRQNLSLLFNQTSLNIYIYIYIYTNTFNIYHLYFFFFFFFFLLLLLSLLLLLLLLLCTQIRWPSCLELQNTPTVSVEE